ncbi:P-loop NTPase [Rhizobium fabae]|uniref:P-loop NTPase n=1 Tax=Rhizobium fabae TaxID=573179 RepID=UPI00406BA526
MQWAVRGDDLNTRPRSGGDWALRGFRFQDAFALWQMSELLTCNGGLVALRYEGAQDVDLMYTDGRQCFVQLKHRPDSQFDWDFACIVMSSFATDELDALKSDGDASNVSYRLVTSSVPVGLEVDSLVRRVKIPSNAASLAKVFPPEIVTGLKKAPQNRLARAVVEKTVVDIRPGVDPCGDMRELAASRLMRFGVPYENIEAVLSVLANALAARRSFDPETILELITPHLPQDHLGRKDVIRIRETPYTSPMATAPFYAKGAFTWSALAAELDLKRDAHDDIMARLVTSTPALHIISGPGGAGKTTMSRRIGWDLHRQGKVFAMSWDPSLAEVSAWERLCGFARAIRRPALIFVDDLFQTEDAVEQIARISPSDPVVILATSRPEHLVGQKIDNANLDVFEHKLRTLSASEIKGLCERLDLPLPASGDLRDFEQSGNILLLIMTLLGGSVREYAKNLLEPIRHRSPELLGAYLDLCLNGRFDRSVPRTILLKRWKSPYFEKEEVLDNLVFVARNSGAYLRSGHANLSQGVIEAEYIDPAERTIDIASFVNPDNDQERRFAIGMLDNLIRAGENHFFELKRGELDQTVRSLIPHCQLADMQRLRRTAECLGISDFERLFAERLATAPPATGPDAALLIDSAKTAEDFQVAFPRLHRFYQMNDTGYARRNFIARCTYSANNNQKEEMLRSTVMWLEAHHYPSAEAKSVLDVIHHTRQLDKSLSTDVTIKVLRGAPRDRLVFRTACSIQAFLKDVELNALIVKCSDAVLTPENVYRDAGVFTIFGGAVRNRLSEVERQRLFDRAIEVLRDVAALSQQAGGKRLSRRLFEAALHFAPDAHLSVGRAQIIEIAGMSRVREHSLDSLKHIRNMAA